MSADPEDFQSENLAELLPFEKPVRNTPQQLPPAHLDDDCWRHDFQELYICKRCGVAEERI